METWKVKQDLSVQIAISLDILDNKSPVLLIYNTCNHRLQKKRSLVPIRWNHILRFLSDSTFLIYIYLYNSVLPSYKLMTKTVDADYLTSHIHVQKNFYCFSENPN